jgi:hypothetical protein
VVSDSASSINEVWLFVYYVLGLKKPIKLLYLFPNYLFSINFDVIAALLRFCGLVEGNDLFCCLGGFARLSIKGLDIEGVESLGSIVMEESATCEFPSSSPKGYLFSRAFAASLFRSSEQRSFEAIRPYFGFLLKQ